MSKGSPFYVLSSICCFLDSHRSEQGRDENLDVFSICISLIVKDVKFCMYLRSICSSFGNCFNSFANLLIGGVWVCCCCCSLCILEFNPQQIERLAKPFPASVVYVFALVIASFALRKDFTQSCLLICYYFLNNEGALQKSLLMPTS